MSSERILPRSGAGAASLAQPVSFRPLPLRLNFAWTLVGNAVYGGAQWAMLILLAKLGNAEMVGRFALGLTVGAPVVMFTNLQLRLVQATDPRDEYVFRDYLSLRLVTSLLALLLIAGVALVGQYRAETLAVIVLVGVAKCVESVSDVIWGLWQKRERLDLISISMMIKGPASLLAMWALLVWTKSLMVTCVGMVAVWTGLLLTFDVGFARRVLAARREPVRRDGRPRHAVLRQLTWLALPLGVVGLLDSLNVNVPRYCVARQLGEAGLGYFAAVAWIMVAGNMVVGALAQSASAELSRRYVQDLPGFLRLLWRLVAFGAALGAAGIVLAMSLGREILSLLYRAEYAAQSNVLVWVMVAAGLGYVARFLIVGTSAARSFRAQAPLYAFALAVVAAGSKLWVPRAGLVGAAWALSAGAAAMLAGAAFILARALRRPPAEVLEPTASRWGVADGS